MLIIRDPNNPNYLPYLIKYFKNIDIMKNIVISIFK